MSALERHFDLVRRFTVEHQAVRGQWVRLGPAWLELREHADYPPAVRQLLGEAVSAAVLLASTLKFEGELTLQMQGDGAVRLLVAQCTHDFKVRAVARFDSARVEAAADFAALAGAGQIAVTIEADRFASRYQGIVPIDPRSLGASVEHYFENSEQLPTRVLLAADDAGTAGVLIQRLPQQGGLVGTDSGAASAVREAESWTTYEQASQGLQNVGSDELLARSATDLMQRILPGFDLRLFDAQPVRFQCRCSIERVSDMLRSLGAAEVDSIVAEQGAVTVTCEFCHKPWRFDAVDAARLFGQPGELIPGSSSVN